jgi:hypothetical protein
VEGAVAKLASLNSSGFGPVAIAMLVFVPAKLGFSVSVCDVPNSGSSEGWTTREAVVPALPDLS